MRPDSERCKYRSRTLTNGKLGKAQSSNPTIDSRLTRHPQSNQVTLVAAERGATTQTTCVISTGGETQEPPAVHNDVT